MSGSVPAMFHVGPVGGLSPGGQLRKQLETASAVVRPETAFVSLTVEVPALNPAGLLDALPGEPVVAYAETIGLGVAAELRLDLLDAAAARTWLRRIGATIAGREAPSIFCGAAFAPEATGKGRWRDFPALLLMLPRWTYLADWTIATLTLTLPVAHLGDRSREDEALAELDRIVTCLEAASPEHATPAKAPRQMSPADWETLVRGALREIGVGRFQKLVLARTAIVEAGEPWRREAIFRRIGSAAATTPFAVGFGATTFLGASPEMLVSSGPQGHFATHALAATIPAGADATALTRSHKNREEHRLVVDEIVRRLRPLCSELDVASEPAVVQLRDVAHLQTPISGRRKDGIDVLDLAYAIHPTPAVGGLPGRPAVDWICSHEPEPRGWYAGFLGWLDGSGAGRLGVAIRSGLISGREACLYTGAGIVAGSDPAAEYEETSWKQRPFLRALGLEA